MTDAVDSLITDEFVEKGFAQWKLVAEDPNSVREAFFGGIIFSQLVMAHFMGKQADFMKMLDEAGPTLQ